MHTGKQFLFKFASKTTAGTVAAIDYHVDVNTFEKVDASFMQLNDIAVVEIQLEQAVVADPYSANRATGAFIIIDRLTNGTVAAGMVSDVINASQVSETEFSAFELEFNALVRKHFPHWEAKDISLLK